MHRYRRICQGRSSDFSRGTTPYPVTWFILHFLVSNHLPWSLGPGSYGFRVWRNQKKQCNLFWKLISGRSSLNTAANKSEQCNFWAFQGKNISRTPLLSSPWAFQVNSVVVTLNLWLVSCNVYFFLYLITLPFLSFFSYFFLLFSSFYFVTFFFFCFCVLSLSVIVLFHRVQINAIKKRRRKRVR